MPESLKVLRRRVRSVKNTRQITRAMEMVSASKLKRAESALLAAKPYNQRLSDMLRRLVLSGKTPENPLFATRDEVKTRLLVVFAADRGLCGAYNANILKAVENFLKRSADEGVGVRVVAVGRRAVEYFQKKQRQVPLIADFQQHGGRVTVELARGIADACIKDFTDGQSDEVLFLYNRFISTTRYRITIDKFLPFDRQVFSSADAADAAAEGSPEGAAATAPDNAATLDYIYEPDAGRVFETLLPRFIQSKVYVALASSMTSEHSARMIAMNSATKNCGELIEKLTLQMNKARQAAITKEIIEIVSGAQAIGG